MRLITIALVLLAVLTACDEDREVTQNNRNPFRPTLEQLHNVSIGLELKYPETTEPFWSSWTGYATLTLLPPTVSNKDLPAQIDFGVGFEGLGMSCLTNGTGIWTYDQDTGYLQAIFVDPAGQESTVVVDGNVVRLGRRLSSGLEYYISGSGTWQITPGKGCGPSVFTGGTTGDWTGEEGAGVGVVPLEEEEEPEVRMTFIHIPTGTTTQAIVPVSQAAALLE